MNGNDIIEIIESHQEEILESYINDLELEKEHIPEDYENEWALKYLETGEEDNLPF